jgi:translation initiation factor IF-3
VGNFNKPKYLRINERIMVSEVRLIDFDGTQAGVVSRSEALKRAYEKGLDLVEIAPYDKPPVCKIIDFGKYKYEQHKSDRQKHKTSTTKEVNVSLNIQSADIEVKLKQAEKFLSRGDKVLIKLMLKGREIIYANRAKEILATCSAALESIASVEQSPTLDGRIMNLLLIPKRSKYAQNKDKPVGTKTLPNKSA